MSAQNEVMANAAEVQVAQGQEEANEVKGEAGNSGERLIAASAAEEGVGKVPAAWKDELKESADSKMLTEGVETEGGRGESKFISDEPGVASNPEGVLSKEGEPADPQVADQNVQVVEGRENEEVKKEGKIDLYNANEPVKAEECSMSVPTGNAMEVDFPEEHSKPDKDAAVSEMKNNAADSEMNSNAAVSEMNSDAAVSEMKIEGGEVPMPVLEEESKMSGGDEPAASGKEKEMDAKELDVVKSENAEHSAMEIEVEAAPRKLEVIVKEDPEVAVSAPPELDDVDFLGLVYVWRTVIQFHTVSNLSPFPLEDLYSAIRDAKLSPLLVEVHISLLRNLVEEEVLIWESGQRPTNTRVRAKFSMDRLQVGSWESLLGDYISYWEGENFRNQLAQVKDSGESGEYTFFESNLQPLAIIKSAEEEYLENGWIQDAKTVIHLMIEDPNSECVRVPGHEYFKVDQDQYKGIVETPIDLQMIERNLVSKVYPTLQNFLDDVQTAWENCFVFSNEESEDVKKVKNLIQTFEAPLESLEMRFKSATEKNTKALQSIISRDSDAESDAGSGAATPRKGKRNRAGKPRPKKSTIASTAAAVIAEANNAKKLKTPRSSGRTSRSSTAKTTHVTPAIGGKKRKRPSTATKGGGRTGTRSASKKRKTNLTKDATEYSDGSDEDFEMEVEDDAESDVVEDADGVEDEDDDDAASTATGAEKRRAVAVSLLHATSMLLKRGYESLSLSQRYILLTWLCDRFVDSDRFRAAIEERSKELEVALSEQEELEESQVSQREHIEQAFLDSQTEVEREMKVYQRLQQRNENQQPKLRPNSLEALSKMKSSPSMRNLSMKLLGRSMVGLNANDILSVGIVEKIVPAKAPPKSSAKKKKSSKSKSRSSKGGRSKSKKKRSSSEVEEEIDDPDYGDEPKLQEESAEPEALEEIVPEVEPTFRCVYDDGGSMPFSISQLFQWILPSDDDLGLSTASESSPLLEENPAMDIDVDATLEFLDASVPPRYFLSPISDLCPPEVGEVVFTLFGYGVIVDKVEMVEVDNKVEVPEQFVVDLYWGGRAKGAKAYLNKASITYRRTSVEGMRSVLRSRAEKERDLKLKAIEVENPEDTKRAEEIASRVKQLNSAIRFPSTLSCGPVSVWNFERLLVFENLEAENHWVVRRIEDFEKLCNEGVVAALVERDILPEGVVPQSELRLFTDSISAIIVDCRDALRRFLDRSEKTPGYLQYVNRSRGAGTTSCPILQKIGGLEQEEKYDKLEALRFTLLRLEGNIAPFCSKRYREGDLRSEFLTVVRKFGICTELPSTNWLPMIEAILVLEKELLFALSGEEEISNCDLEAKTVSKEDVAVETKVQDDNALGNGTEVALTPKSLITPFPYSDGAAALLTKPLSPTNVTVTTDWYRMLHTAYDLIMRHQVDLATLEKEASIKTTAEENFVRFSFRCFLKKYRIKFTEENLNDMVAWTREFGWNAADAAFESRYGRGLKKMYPPKLGARGDTYNNPSSANVTAVGGGSTEQPDSKVKSLQPGLSSKIEFVRDWLSIKDLWLEALRKKSLSVEDLMNQVLVFEQACLGLSEGLTFAECIELFSSPEKAVPKSLEVKPGDKVEFNSALHTAALQQEASELRQARSSIKMACANGSGHSKNSFDASAALVNVKGFSTLWCADGSLPEHSRLEFQVYLAEYFAGGGEPYCAVTLGPISVDMVERTPLKDQSAHVGGRRRIMNKLCRNLACRKFVIEGNFGFCEDHRSVSLIDPSKLKMTHQQMVESIAAGRSLYNDKSNNSHREDGKQDDDEACFICLDGGEVFVCDVRACSRVYHQDCLKLRHVPDGDWECPLHKKSDLTEIDQFNEVILMILGQICSIPTSKAFLPPVTGQAGYTDVIEKPICLQDMRFKALHKEYRSVAEVITDVELLKDNCQTWCKTRFPSLPPLALRTVRSMKAALKRVGPELQTLENAISAFMEKNKPNEVSTEQVEVANGTEAATSSAEGKGKGGKAKRSRRSRILGGITESKLDGRRSSGRSRRSMSSRTRKVVSDGSSYADGESGERRCGECANCVFRDQHPGLYNATLVRCLKVASSDSDGPICTLVPRKKIMIKTPQDAVIWEEPSGIVQGAQNVQKTFFTIVVPLAKRFPNFLLSPELLEERAREVEKQRQEERARIEQEKKKQQARRQQIEKQRQLALEQREQAAASAMSRASSPSQGYSRGSSSYGQGQDSSQQYRGSYSSYPNNYSGYSSNAPPAAQPAAAEQPSYQVRYFRNDPVEVRYNGNWYPATIVGHVSEGLYTIQYSNGTGGNVGVLNLRHPPNSAVARTNLHVGDHVQVAYSGAWYDARIVKSTGPTFSVEYALNSQVEHNVDPSRVRPL